MRAIDSNLILRFLLNDNPKQAKAVQRLFESSIEPIILTDIVFAEVVWVLTSFYKLPKIEIIPKLKILISTKAISANRKLLNSALSFYQLRNIDFIDAYLAAYCEEEKLRGIYSYDKGFDKIRTIKRFEP